MSVARAPLVALVALVLTLGGCGDGPDALSSRGGSSSSGGSSSGAPVGEPVSLTERREGVATFYDADGSGNCSFDKTSSDDDVVALGPAAYAGARLCGACVEVEGPRGQVAVRVVDQCPECEADHLDLSRHAFAAIADPVQGRVSIRYTLTSCAISGPISYQFKDGSSKYYTAIRVDHHRLPIAKLEVRRAGGTFAAVSRESYNYFVVSDGIGDPGAIELRLTSTNGQTITDRINWTGGPGVVPGTAQFQ